MSIIQFLITKCQIRISRFATFPSLYGGGFSIPPRAGGTCSRVAPRPLRTRAARTPARRRPPAQPRTARRGWRLWRTPAGQSDGEGANRYVKVWRGATENGPLNQGHIPNSRGVRVHVGTGYNRGERNRRVSRNGRVSDPPPGIPDVTIRHLLSVYGRGLRLGVKRSMVVTVPGLDHLQRVA